MPDYQEWTVTRLLLLQKQRAESFAVMRGYIVLADRFSGETEEPVFLHYAKMEQDALRENQKRIEQGFAYLQETSNVH